MADRKTRILRVKSPNLPGQGKGPNDAYRYGDTGYRARLEQAIRDAEAKGNG